MGPQPGRHYPKCEYLLQSAHRLCLPFASAGRRGHRTMTKISKFSSRERLRNHRLFASRELDEARDLVAGKFCRHRLERQRVNDDFDACHNHAAGLDLSLNYLRYGADVEIEPGELGSFYLIQIPIKGRATITNGREHTQATTSVATILNPTRHTHMQWHAGCEKLLVQIDRAVLQALAEDVVGYRLPGPVVFRSEIALTEPAMKAWLSKLMTCIQSAEYGWMFCGAANLSQCAVEQELILDFLQHQPSNIDHFLTADRRGHSKQLRQALDFIHDNLGAPIKVTDLSRAAGVNVRTLQLAFSRQFGLTPMQYVRQVRLNLAHFRLLSGGANAAVTDIALELGFMHLGRFAVEYRRRFGQSPRATLAR